MYRPPYTSNPNGTPIAQAVPQYQRYTNNPYNQYTGRNVVSSNSQPQWVAAQPYHYHHHFSNTPQHQVPASSATSDGWDSVSDKRLRKEEATGQQHSPGPSGGKYFVEMPTPPIAPVPPASIHSPATRGSTSSGASSNGYTPGSSPGAAQPPPSSPPPFSLYSRHGHKRNEVLEDRKFLVKYKEDGERIAKLTYGDDCFADPDTFLTPSPICMYGKDAKEEHRHEDSCNRYLDRFRQFEKQYLAAFGKPVPEGLVVFEGKDLALREPSRAGATKFNRLKRVSIDVAHVKFIPRRLNNSKLLKFLQNLCDRAVGYGRVRVLLVCDAIQSSDLTASETSVNLVVAGESKAALAQFREALHHRVLFDETKVYLAKKQKKKVGLKSDQQKQMEDSANTINAKKEELDTNPAAAQEAADDILLGMFAMAIFATAHDGAALHRHGYYGATTETAIFNSLPRSPLVVEEMDQPALREKVLAKWQEAGGGVLVGEGQAVIAPSPVAAVDSHNQR